MWEEISDIKERKVIKGKDVEEVRMQLDAYQKTINLISSRINQMGAYVHTRADIAKENLLKTSGHGPYIRYAEAMAALIDKFYAGRKPATPEKIADIICKAVNAKKPRTRYIATNDARRFIFLKWLLPDRVFDYLLLRLMKVSM